MIPGNPKTSHWLVVGLIFDGLTYPPQTRGNWPLKRAPVPSIVPKDKSSSGSQVLPPFRSITSDFRAKSPTMDPVVTRSFAKDRWYLKKQLKSLQKSQVDVFLYVKVAH